MLGVSQRCSGLGFSLSVPKSQLPEEPEQLGVISAPTKSSKNLWCNPWDGGAP